MQGATVTGGRQHDGRVSDPAPHQKEPPLSTTDTIDPNEATKTELAEIQHAGLQHEIQAGSGTLGLPSRTEMDMIVAEAEYLANDSALVGKHLFKKPVNVAYVMLIARDLGMAPTWGLSKIYIVEGRPTLAAEAMRGLVLKAGHHIEVVEYTHERVTLVGWREGAEKYALEISWDVKDAQRADLLRKDNWIKYTRAMLAARATAELCRLKFPDVLLGMTYAPEDFDAHVGADGKLHEARPAPTQPVDPAWFREAVLAAFDTELEVPENHPYRGKDTALDRLRALHLHLQAKGWSMTGATVRDLDGTDVEAEKFYLDAGRAAVKGEPFVDRTPAPDADTAGGGDVDATAAAEDAGVAEVELVDDPGAGDQAHPGGDAVDDAVDAEVVPPADQPQEGAQGPQGGREGIRVDLRPTQGDLPALWGAELQWQADVLGMDMNHMGKRQIAMAKAQDDRINDVHQLPLRLLAKVVRGHRDQVVQALRQARPAIAAAYVELLDQVELVGGEVPVPVTDLA